MKKDKLNINLFMLLIILLGLETITTDILSYLFKLPYWLTTLFSISLIIIALIFVRKKIKIKNDLDKSDLIFFGILIFLMIIHLPFADEMYDTMNYHLYLQERPFSNKLYQDFFPGRYINTFSYAFPDRMFYLFRFFLGYRLGVILNYIILCTLYYQCKNIIKNCFKVKNIFVAILSIIIVINLSVLEQIDNYYVDLLSLVFLLEVFNIAFCNENEHVFFQQNILFLLISGMAFATKISNAFFIIIFSLIYLIKNRHAIIKTKWWQYLIYVVVFCFPFLLYMFYTYKETGNPVFPFYNTIFKSTYYPLSNWMDNRFGPKSLLELFLWPILAFFYPERVADTHICEPMWAFGYIISIIVIFNCCYKKIRKKEYSSNLFLLSITSFLLYLIWSKFLLGYTRYAIIVVLIGTLVVILSLYNLLISKKYVFSSVLIITLLINWAYTGHYYMFSGYSLFYDNITNSSKDNYLYNIKHLLDKNEEIITFPEKSCWGVINENSGELLLMNNRMDILNLTYGASTKKAEEILNKNLEKYEHIYTAVKYSDLEYFFERLNQFNFDIVDIYDVAVPSYIENLGFYYIFEIANGNYQDNYLLFYQNTEIDIQSKDKIYIGFHPFTREGFSKNYYLSIYGIENNEEKLIKRIYRDSQQHGVEIDLKEIKYNNIKLQIEEENKEIIPLNMILIDY